MVTPSSRLRRRKSSKIWPRRRVELAGRLVGEDDVGPLASATAIATRCCSPPGQAGPGGGRHGLEVHLPEQLERPAVPCVRRTPSRIIGSATFSAAVRYGSRLRGLLPDEADDLAQVARLVARAQLVELVAGDDSPAGGRHVETAEDVEERALARPGRADEGDELARFDEQVETLKRDDLEASPD
jgi:hypothetical protein